MKKIVCTVLMFVTIVCALVSCESDVYESPSINLKDECSVAFDYFSSKNYEVSFYDIEKYEYERSERASLFDNGIIYKITIFRNEYTKVMGKIYYFGKLNGEDILYFADYYDYSYGCYEYRLLKCEL